MYSLTGWPLLPSLASSQATLSHLAPDILAFSLFLEHNFPTPELSYILFPHLKRSYPLLSTCRVQFTVTPLDRRVWPPIPEMSSYHLPAIITVMTAYHFSFQYVPKWVGIDICVLNCLIPFLLLLCDLRPRHSQHQQCLALWWYTWNNCSINGWMSFDQIKQIEIDL